MNHVIVGKFRERFGTYRNYARVEAYNFRKVKVPCLFFVVHHIN